MYLESTRACHQVAAMALCLGLGGWKPPLFEAVPEMKAAGIAPETIARITGLPLARIAQL